jgi:hypothetical protein
LYHNHGKSQIKGQNKHLFYVGSETIGQNMRCFTGGGQLFFLSPAISPALAIRATVWGFPGRQDSSTSADQPKISGNFSNHQLFG